MGYGGKVREQLRARELRAEAWTLQDIATELGVSKSSVSLWVRDVEFTPSPRRRTRAPRPSSLHIRKLAEIERCQIEGVDRIGVMTEREFLVMGLALYAGEGSKTDGEVRFANTDSRMMSLFAMWLRRFFDIDEERLKMRLYLHEGLDLDAANEFWSELLDVPLHRFRTPYRAVPDPSIRRSKHQYGCPALSYTCSLTHRRVMGMVSAILSPSALPG